MGAVLDRLALAVTADIPAAEALLRNIPNDDPVPFAPYLAEQIRSGRYQARDILCDGARVGVTVYQLDGDASELVSVATVTVRPVPDFAEFWQRAIEDIARAHGCRSIRMHTCRAGLVRGALTAGWHVAEIILRKPLT